MQRKIFHGGCLGCISQHVRGLWMCRHCKYHKSDWSKPNLFMMPGYASNAPTVSKKSWYDSFHVIDKIVTKAIVYGAGLSYIISKVI